MLCHVSVHSGAFCLRHRARDPISVAFFDRVALFSDFNYLFELLDKVLLPIAVCLLYVGIKLKKHFNNAHCQFHEQFSCRKRLFPIQSLAVERSLSESRGGSKVTKRIFGNSGKRYSYTVTLPSLCIHVPLHITPSHHRALLCFGPFNT